MTVAGPAHSPQGCRRRPQLSSLTPYHAQDRPRLQRCWVARAALHLAAQASLPLRSRVSRNLPKLCRRLHACARKTGGARGHDHCHLRDTKNERVAIVPVINRRSLCDTAIKSRSSPSAIELGERAMKSSSTQDALQPPVSSSGEGSIALRRMTGKLYVTSRIFRPPTKEAFSRATVAASCAAAEDKSGGADCGSGAVDGSGSPAPCSE